MSSVGEKPARASGKKKETVLMLMRSLLFFLAGATSPQRDVSFEVSLLPVSQDDHDLNQTTLCLGQMKAKRCSP